LGIANVVRGIQAFVVAPVFTSLAQPQPLSVSLTVLGLIYLAWGVVLLIVAMHYVRHRWRPPRVLALGVGLGYQMTLWLIRLFGYRSAYAQRLWLRDLVLSALLIAVVVLLTWPFKRRSPS
jgi:hypothetical protein